MSRIEEKEKNGFAGVGYIILTFIGLWIWGGCANQLSPTGGDRDKIPPELVKTIPLNQSLNVSSKSFTFVFNEPVILPKYNEEVFISPLLEKRPTIILSDNAKRVKIKFNENLLENTTYVIALNAIKDNHERNEMKQSISYAFSTGAQLDSMQIEGQIWSPVANVGRAEMLVMLFDADSIQGNDLLRKRPSYITRTDSFGVFSFSYLRNVSYKVFGIMDDDKSNTYSQPSEEVAVGKDTILTFPDTSIKASAILYSFKQDEMPPILLDYDWLSDSTLKCQFDEAWVADSLQVTQTDTLGRDSAKILSWSAFQNTDHELYLAAYRPRDSVSYLKMYGLQDSLGNARDTALLIRSGTVRKPENPVIIKPAFDQNDKKMKLSLGWILSEYDSTQIYLSDTARYRKELDTLGISFPEGIKEGEFYKRLPWEVEQDQFNLNLVPGFTPEPELNYVLHIEGDLWDEEDTTYRYVVKWPDIEEFGTLSGKITIQGYEGPIILAIVKDEKIVKRTYKREYFFDYLEPGNYQMQVTLDEDGNKAWTPGILKEGKLPEFILKDNQPISIRANWDIEAFDINFTPPAYMGFDVPTPNISEPVEQED
ncbi:MAG: Ig-like domain-containing protein [Bacteroidota bacterium]